VGDKNSGKEERNGENLLGGGVRRKNPRERVLDLPIAV
jgi:hypothetical protein